MSKASIRTSLRAAAPIVLLVVAAAISGCAADNSRVATSGTSVPGTASGAWVHTPNEPDWQGLSYTAH